jgi:hypothetical protein
VRRGVPDFDIYSLVSNIFKNSFDAMLYLCFLKSGWEIFIVLGISHGILMIASLFVRILF